jgi:DNA-binding transcriptional regulator YdaS (Cro superfamily)
MPLSVAYPLSMDAQLLKIARKAINQAGGPGKVARCFAITSQAVSQWRRIPEDRVVEMERISGISRHDLRPDLSRIFSRSGEIAA